MTRLHSLCISALLGASACLSAHAAEAVPTDPSRPVTAVRVGGSPADLAFRNARQKNGDDYRAARAACTAGARGERTPCMRAARVKLKQDGLAAKAAHDAAR